MSSRGRTLCIFGTASDVGKSWIVTGLCRLLRQEGIDIAPFKAQNMSNNAGVTPSGREMGRAQIVQAEASGLAPHVDMNPILLKPNTDTGSQVIKHGILVGNMEARAYFSGRMDALRPAVLESLHRLRERHDLIVVEGAGSCAEVNLRDRDLVNFPVAHHAQAPVILVADIHRGGVFAQIVGTLEVMPVQDRARVAGMIINRFRGDPTLFKDGRAWLEERTQLPVLGVIPWTREFRIESEDGLPPDAKVDAPPPTDRGRVQVAIIRLPHIANFTDFDALETHGAAVHYLAKPRDLSAYDLLILPGTKNTRGDLSWMKRVGWSEFIDAHAVRGGTILGICGGYQILGHQIIDPDGVEGPPGSSDGLGLLTVSTVMAPHKRTSRTQMRWEGHTISGYEIHAGVTQRGPNVMPFAEVIERDGNSEVDQDGARSTDGRVLGTYLHGLFDTADATHKFLTQIRPDLDISSPVQSHMEWKETQYDALAEHLRGSLDVPRLLSIIDSASPLQSSDLS